MHHDTYVTYDDGFNELIVLCARCHEVFYGIAQKMLHRRTFPPAKWQVREEQLWPR